MSALSSHSAALDLILRRMMQSAQALPLTSGLDIAIRNLDAEAPAPGAESAPAWRTETPVPPPNRLH